MSGATPGSERERELQAFASRVLAWPDPDGPFTVELLPNGYPGELPPELVDYPDLRFLGSVVRRRDQELLAIELLFEAAGGPHENLVAFEQGLEQAGWQRVNQPGLPRGGFEGGGMPLASTLVNMMKRTRVYVQSFSELAQSLLRVMYSPPTDDELPDDLDVHAAPGRSPLPGLKPPAGVRVLDRGSRGGGGQWSAQAKAVTDMPPADLEAHFAKQLEAAGWRGWEGRRISPLPGAVGLCHSALQPVNGEECSRSWRRFPAS